VCVCVSHQAFRDLLNLKNLMITTMRMDARCERVKLVKQRLSYERFYIFDRFFVIKSIYDRVYTLGC